eukprot:gene4181-20367_t
MGDIDIEFIPDTQSEDYKEPAFSFQAIKSATGKSYQSKKKIKKFEWKDEIVELVIDLWQNQTLLFDASHPNYRVKEKRRYCINAIIASLDDQTEVAKSADRVFAEMLGGMLETIQDGQTGFFENGAATAYVRDEVYEPKQRHAAKLLQKLRGPARVGIP